MKQVNVFHKGIVADIDYTLVPEDAWVFPTVGARVMNLGGKGFVIQNLEGTKELFNIGDDNVPLGAVEHDGILYIAFTKLSVPGEGSIGSYPAPSSWAAGAVGLVNEFKVLKNFIPIGGITPQDLTTTQFNFSVKNKVRIKAKTSYDSSVELYMADGRNPLRVVNSGFRRDGTILQRYIYEAQFDSSLNVIQSSAHKPVFSFLPFGLGDLLNGNYFIFVRYVTDDFNNTEFISESFAFSLYQEASDNNAFNEGGRALESSGRAINFTLTNVDTSYKYLEFAALRYFGDNAPIQYESYLYKEYVEITGSTVSVNIAYMDKMIPYPEEDIFRYRNRDICPKDIEYFDNTLWGANWKEKDRFHVVLKEYASRVMIFPKVLSVGDIAYNEVIAGHSPFINQPPIIRFYRPGDFYEDPKMVYESSSYFRGETYAFALIYTFNDGDVTDGYPTAGRDDYNNTTCHVNVQWVAYMTSSKFNKDGLYRTPKADLVSNDGVDRYQLLKHNDRRLLYLSFDFSEANRWLNEDAIATDREWLQKNIKSLCVARNERKDNLITQGLSLSLVKPTGTLNTILGEYGNVPNYLISGNYPTANIRLHLPDNSDWDDPNLNIRFAMHGRRMRGDATEEYEIGKDYKFPYYNGLIPMWGQMIQKSLYGLWDEFTALSWAVMGVANANEYGVYSPDMMYDRTIPIDSVNFIKRVARNINKITTTADGKKRHEGLVGARYHIDVFPEDTLLAAVSYTTTPRGAVRLSKKAVPLKGNETVINGGGFDGKCIANAFDIGDGNLCHFYHKSSSSSIETSFANRNILSLPYIALQQDVNDANSDVFVDITDLNYASKNNFDDTISHNLDIVNLYIENPETLDILTWYSKQYLFYLPVTEGIAFEDLNGYYAVPNIVNVWRGDCYLNRSTMNLYGWSNSQCKSDKKGQKIVGDAIDDTQTGKYGTDWADWMGEFDKIKYGHGCTVSVVTENRHNVAYRYHNRLGQNTYWDKTLGGGGQAAGTNWLIRCWKNTTREALLYNTGNSQSLSGKRIPIYPYLQPYNEVVHPTRVRFSNRYTPGAFLDANRQFEIMHYKDYDMGFGAINAIYENNNSIITVQDLSINKHFVNEKALSIDSVGAELMLGTASEYLLQQVQQLGAFGSKQQWATFKTDRSIYGVDFSKNIIWRSGLGLSGDRVIFDAEDISFKGSILSWLKDLYADYNPNNNPLLVLRDTPAEGEGITIGYDRQHKEVMFTFLYYTVGTFDSYDRIRLSAVNASTHFNSIYAKYFVASKDNKIYYSLIDNNHLQIDNISVWRELEFSDLAPFNPGTYNAGEKVYGVHNNKLYLVVVRENTIAPVTSISELFRFVIVLLPDGTALYHSNRAEIELIYLKHKKRTLVYSEKIEAFVGEYPFYPKFYAELENLMFSSVNNKIHVHNQKDSLQVFHGGKIEEFVISFVVNGKTADGSAAIFFKYFCSLDIEITDVALRKINYKTDLQEGVYVYSKNSDEFWKDAEYFEGKLKVPIFVQTDPDTQWENNTLEFYQESDMKGTYLVVSLYYKPTTDAQRITLKNAITNFNISQS